MTGRLAAALAAELATCAGLLAAATGALAWAQQGTPDSPSHKAPAATTTPRLARTGTRRGDAREEGIAAPIPGWT
jgi:hypothetical protein